MALFTGISAGPAKQHAQISRRSFPLSSIQLQLVPTMKFTLLFIMFAPMVFGDAFNFPTAGCVDEAGTTACLALADSDMAASCSTLCGCTDPFTCSQASDACLTGCVCVATQSYLNCVLSSCWNKVCYALVREKPSLT